MNEHKDQWLGKKTPILVIAISGRIGSGTSFVSKALLSELKTYNYQTHLIKVTKQFLEEEGDSITSNPAERITALQEKGNQKRQQCGNEYLGVRCIQYILDTLNPPLEGENECLNSRVAYIIDSLKHPEEVNILRSVFRDSFWMIGVVADDSTRRKRLVEQKQLEEAFDKISERDANENRQYGQNSIKTILEADYFFANNYDKETKIPTECKRFLNILFQETIETPRQDEYGMHLAFMAANNSACLSRQVGAALISSDGLVLSTGCNDVPQFGGGLYSSESIVDNRCFARSRLCHNDQHKEKIADEIVEKIKSEVNSNADNWQDKSNKIKSILLDDTRLKQLIEFSRAVHAEMDAIISLARSGKIGLVGSTMYVTTYPCHNCAKHIIDAGICRIVFVEPYEKSLAKELHSDAINQPLDERSISKISFDNYGGVSPKRYSDFFSIHLPRKDKDTKKLISRNKDEILPLGAQETIALKSRLVQFRTSYLPNNSCTCDLDPS
jgi:deoxycytidylate deaminase